MGERTDTHPPQLLHGPEELQPGCELITIKAGCKQLLTRVSRGFGISLLIHWGPQDG